MTSSDFVHIANRTGPARADRLFRAAVMAFCALVRPTRREVVQLADLVLPLFDAVSRTSRRFVAACLSESADAPMSLIRRLADEPIDVSAPLIVRSPLLGDIDLVALIGRHGLPHARAIGCRADLNPAIANLVRALQRNSSPVHATGDPAMPKTATASAIGLDEEGPAPAVIVDAESPAERVRHRLRAMMLPSEATSRAAPGRGATTGFSLDYVPRGAIFGKLRTTALTGNSAYFQTALADALGVGFQLARALTEGDGYLELIFAFKALDLDAEEAFILAAALFPAHFARPEGIRLFIERYELCHPDAARDRLRGWKADTLAASMDAARRPDAVRGSNANRPPLPGAGLKAS